MTINARHQDDSVCVHACEQVVKHIHVTINARHEDDLDEQAVLKKIQTASGANYDAASVKG